MAIKNVFVFRAYAENIQRPFGVKYNPYTQTVDVLSSAKRITAAVSELRGDLSIVSSALRKVSALDQDLDVEKITQMLQAGLQVTRIFLLRKNFILSIQLNESGSLSKTNLSDFQRSCLTEIFIYILGRRSKPCESR